MFPPSAPGGVSHVDLSALSGIAGSISIACWVVVFSPQIIENFRRRSADGLSVTFIIAWLLGDVFNILGAVLQGVLPTMIILAIYYTLADIVLLGQVWYYRGFTFSDRDLEPSSSSSSSSSSHSIDDAHRDSESGRVNGERTPLLAGESSTTNKTLQVPSRSRHHSSSSQQRSGSFSALRRHLSMDGSHLSPAMPLLDDPPNATNKNKSKSASIDIPSSVVNMKKLSSTQAFLFNTFAILLVCAAGVGGWYISRTTHHKNSHNDGKTPKPHHSHPFFGSTIGNLSENPKRSPGSDSSLHFDTWGQIFGYLCAILYLGSRIPQLLLNYRRKSTEGVSMLFFLFACIGNLTYDMSIFAFDPSSHCAHPHKCLPGEKSGIYGRYIAVNASWIAGSLGTLLLDLAIFVQFFLYRVDDDDDDVDIDVDVDDDNNKSRNGNIVAAASSHPPRTNGVENTSNNVAVVD